MLSVIQGEQISGGAAEFEVAGPCGRKLLTSQSTKRQKGHNKDQKADTPSKACPQRPTSES